MYINFSVQIGQTGTRFKKLFAQHRRAVGKEDATSAFSQHLNQFQHSCDFDRDFRVLHFSNKGKKLDRLENIEINKASFVNQPICNDLLYLNHSPLLDLAA